MAIISIFKKKEEQDFEKLIDENKMRFYKTAKSILKNDDDVYDAIQEALISIYQNFDKLENKEYFTTWGIRIVINKCYDHIRKNKKSENNIYIDDEENPIDIPVDEKNSIEKLELEDLLNKLSEEKRLITTLYYYDEISVKEIAQMLEMPEGTVKYKLSEIRKELRAMIEGSEV